MSEVKRYAPSMKVGRMVKDPEGLWVCLQDYDAAQSELAALREELAKFDEGMRALACSLGAGGYNAETLTADQLVGKVQWGIDNIITVQEQRLTAAEQRNSIMTKALQRIARPHDCGCLPCTGDCTSKLSLEITVDEMRELAESALAQPTESGASE